MQEIWSVQDRGHAWLGGRSLGASARTLSLNMRHDSRAAPLLIRERKRERHPDHNSNTSMPLYYATSRKDNQRSQGGGPSSYVRSAPSTLFYVTLSALVPWILALAYTFFGSSVYLIFHPLETERILESAWGFAAASMVEVFPVRLPGIAIRFKGAPRSHYIERLEMMGATVSRLPGSRVDTWLLERTSKDMLGEILTFDGMETFRPPAGFICSTHIESVALLVTRLYVVSRTLSELSKLSTADNLSIRYKAPTAGITEVVDESDSEEEEEEEGEVMKDRTAKEKRSAVKVGEDTTPTLVTIKERPSEYEFIPVYSRDVVLPSHGIVVPFERNYAAPDPNALNVFFSECGKTLVRKGPQPVSQAAGVRRAGEGSGDRSGQGSGGAEEDTSFPHLNQPSVFVYPLM